MTDQRYPYQHIYERDHFTCQYCGWDGRASFERWWIANFSISQIKPSSHGGTDEDDNLVLSCHACVQHKGDADYNSLEEVRNVIGSNRSHAASWFERYVVLK